MNKIKFIDLLPQDFFTDEPLSVNQLNDKRKFIGEAAKTLINLYKKELSKTENVHSVEIFELYRSIEVEYSIKNNNRMTHYYDINDTIVSLKNAKMMISDLSMPRMSDICGSIFSSTQLILDSFIEEYSSYLKIRKIITDERDKQLRKINEEMFKLNEIPRDVNLKSKWNVYEKTPCETTSI